MNAIYNKFLSELFLKDLKNKEFKLELSQKIFETYEKRKALFLSQKALSELIGISESTIKRIENGNCYDIRIIEKYNLQTHY